jgi:NTP pyrophosphatase (non-canonical NTP hydrolase)
MNKYYRNVWEGTREEEFIIEILDEVERAREKHPGVDVAMAALTEEVGELAEALMDKPWGEVRKEAVQVAAVALRVALEGDDSMLKLRAKKDLDTP